MNAQIDLHGQTRSLQRRLNCHAASATVTPSHSIARRLRTLLGRSEEGSALVEIALTMPILMAMITALCTFAIGFNNQLALTNAVDMGGRQLQLIRTTTSDPCADTLTAMTNAAPSLKANSISLSFNFNGTVVNGSSCAGDQSDLVSGAPVTVTAKYPCVLSIMPMGYGTNFVSNCQLSAKVTEYEY